MLFIWMKNLRQEGEILVLVFFLVWKKKKTKTFSSKLFRKEIQVVHFIPLL